jgi:uncharacterized membrane protein
MYNDRPKIKVPYESVDYVMELVCIALLILMWAYAFVEHASLPDIIPTHFNSAGIADDYGSKSTIFIMPVIGSLVYLLLFVVNMYPHIHNYSVNITAENALKNYRFSTRFLRTVNVLMCLLFTYITYNIVESATASETGIGSFFLPIVIGISVLLPVFGLYYQSKINRTKK